VIAPAKGKRFLDAAQRLPALPPAELAALNIVLPPDALSRASRDTRGIF
jgi:hypothetical protein